MSVMKYVLFLILLVMPLWSTEVYATDKTVCSAGCDYSTLTAVNTARTSFTGGDRILFNRGETFRGYLITGKGSCDSSDWILTDLTDDYIYYGSYGTGSNPIIMPSYSGNTAGDWTNTAGNMWSFSSAFEIGNIIFNNDSSFGYNIAYASSVDVDAQGEYYYDKYLDTVNLYSVGNPTTVYTNIELAYRGSNDITSDAINIKNWDGTAGSCVLVDSLDIKYSASQGYSINGWGGYTPHHIIIRKGTASYIGGAWGGSTTVRYGNGFQIFDRGYEILLEKNIFNSIYDAGISPQGTASDGNFYNIYMRNNIIESPEFCYEYWLSSSTASGHDIYFENNTCQNMGSPWSHGQRVGGDEIGSFFRIGDNKSTASKIFIRNNIFRISQQNGMFFYYTRDIPEITINNNDYLHQGGATAGTAFVRVYYDSLKYDTFADWKTAYPYQDASSINTEPLMKVDYSLYQSSPAINAGVYLPEVSDDYNGNPRIGADIGAFTYGRTSYKGLTISMQGTIK